MEYRRTAVIKLDVPDDTEGSLRETVAQFNECANRASEWCWHGDGDYHVTSKAKAESALYRELKDGHDLTANLVQKATRRAVEAVKSGVARLKRGERTSRPHFAAPSVVYDKRSATFERDRVSLSTVAGRVECEYVVPSNPDAPYHEYVADESWEFRTSTLQERGGEWFLHASMHKYVATDPEPDTEHRTVLGVDLGVENIAVASTGRFWSADEFNHWRREYERRRGSLAKTGSRAAHEAIGGVGRKEYGRFEHHLHHVANELVAEAVEHDCSTIAFEDLTHIRERLPEARWQHIWAFRRLRQYIEYKAPEHGLEVVDIAPDHTSQRCSTCGFTARENRTSQADFECQNCGYANHADYNAAKNIGFRYLRRRQNADDGGAPVGVRLNRGTLNVSGEYVPPPTAGDGATA